MITIGEIDRFLEKKTPRSYKMDFDNVGLLVGDTASPVYVVLLALDITEEVVEEAISIGANLIVSHHPLFFSLKSVNSETSQGKRVLRLIEHKISAICMHTNLDATSGGVNDALAEKVGLSDIEPLEVSGIDENGEFYGVGRIGSLPREMFMTEYLQHLMEALKTNGLRYYDAGKPVMRVAVGGGACGDYMETALKKGCDTFLTSDIKYDVFLNAKQVGMNIIDGDHFCTENVIIPVLEKWLAEAFPRLEIGISKTHGQTIKFF